MLLALTGLAMLAVGAVLAMAAYRERLEDKILQAKADPADHCVTYASSDELDGLLQEIQSSACSFDYISTRAHSLRNNILPAVARVIEKRGIKLRILIADPDGEDFSAIPRARGEDVEKAKELSREAIGDLEVFRDGLSEEAKERFTVGLVDGTLFFKGWIRDGQKSCSQTNQSPTAHVSVLAYSYIDRAKSPKEISFRCGAAEDKVIKNLQAEFDHLWDREVDSTILSEQEK